MVTWKWSGGEPHQIWIAASEKGNLGILGGAFRLSTAHLIDETKVLDQGLGSTKLIIWVGIFPR